ncbi:cytochrome c biogenesis CcdA family protein [Acidipropionibacterium virtanenii]|nr:cytochrome c biogenesis protein CcdA [Acidipropionibacterium virtanenii]
MIGAVPVAVFAGLVSFFSPCVLPLVPGYLSYATGQSAAELAGGRRRAVLGSVLFILGFGVVFVATGTLVGGLGRALVSHQRTIEILVGALAVLLGAMFAGLVPLGRREFRLHRLPRAGLAAAPVLGVVFGLGWTPCIGPALTVVYGLSFSQGSAAKGAVLAACYAAGLGLPFVAAGAALARLARTVTWVKAHQRLVQRSGGVLMMAVGVALVTGWWDVAMAALRSWAARFGAVI